MPSVANFIKTISICEVVVVLFDGFRTLKSPWKNDFFKEASVRFIVFEELVTLESFAQVINCVMDCAQTYP